MIKISLTRSDCSSLGSSGDQVIQLGRERMFMTSLIDSNSSIELYQRSMLFIR